MKLISIPSPKHLEQFFWLAFNTLASFIFGILIIKLLLKLPESEFGEYNLILSLQAFISLLLFGPFEQALVRFYNEYVKNSGLLIFLNLIVRYLVFFTFFLIAFILILFYTPLGDYFQIDFFQNGFYNCLLGIIFIFFFSWNIITTSLLNIIQRRKEIFLSTLFERGGTFLILALLSINSTFTLSKVILCISLILIFTSLLKWKIFIHQSKMYCLLNDYSSNYETNELHLKNQKLSSALLSFMIPFVIWGLASWLQSNSDKWIISYHMSKEDVAHYSLFLSLASYFITVPINLISQFLQPLLYTVSEIDNDLVQKRKRLMTFLMLISALIILVAILISFFFGNMIVVFLSNENYLKNVAYLPLICFALGIFQIAQNLTFHGMILQQSKIYIGPKLIAGLIAILLNIILIKSYQFSGLVIASFISSLFLLALIHLSNIRLSKI